MYPKTMSRHFSALVNRELSAYRKCVVRVCRVNARWCGIWFVTNL